HVGERRDVESIATRGDVMRDAALRDVETSFRDSDDRVVIWRGPRVQRTRGRGGSGTAQRESSYEGGWNRPAGHRPASVGRVAGGEDQTGISRREPLLRSICCRIRLSS